MRATGRTRSHRRAAWTEHLLPAWVSQQRLIVRPEPLNLNLAPTPYQRLARRADWAVKRAGCQKNPLRGQRALEEIRSRIGTAASRDAVIGLEQGRISRSWQPDATTSRWRPRPNPGFGMFRVVQHEWEQTGMHSRYLWARRPAIAGDVVYRGSVLSRCVPACLTCPAAAYRAGTPFGHIPGHAEGPLPAGKGP